MSSKPPISRPRVAARRALLASGFARDAAVLMIGTFAGQGLNLAASPVISRLYLPEHLGVLGLVTSVYSLVTPLACWRYEQAIMLPKQDQQAASLYRLALLITGLMVTVGLLVSSLVGRQITLLVGHPEAADWLWAIPALVALAGTYQTGRAWLARSRRFGGIAAGRITRAGVSVAGQVCAGLLWGAGAWWLVGSYLLGLGLEAVVLSGYAWRSDWAQLRAHVGLRWLASQAVRHQKFPLFSVPGGLSTYLGTEAPTLLLAIFFSPAIVGLYWMSYRALAIPIALISDSVSTVFYQRMSALQGDSRAGAPLMIQLFAVLFALASVPMAVMYVFAPTIFGVAFGSAWAEAGDYARALVPSQVMLFASFPIHQAFFIYEKQDVALVWQTAFLIASVLAFVLGALVGGSALAAVQCYSVTAAVMYGLVVVLAVHWAGGTMRDAPRYLAEGLHDRLGRTVHP